MGRRNLRTVARDRKEWRRNYWKPRSTTDCGDDDDIDDLMERNNVEIGQFKHVKSKMIGNKESN